MKQFEKTITSLEVSEMVEKTHANLLKDIRNYIEQLAEVKFYSGDFFTESTYQDGNKQLRPCYNITKKGCEFIAHKLTGLKGTGFTARYINRFHDMEEQIVTTKSPLQLLELEFAAIKEVDSKVEAVNEDLQQFKMELPILGIEEDKITNAVRSKGVRCLGGKGSNAYSDNSLRGKQYRDIYQELYRQFGITTYKALKRNQCDTAVAIIESYKPPLVLAENIQCVNAQMNLEV